MKRISEHKRADRIGRFRGLVPIADYAVKALESPFGFGGFFRAMREPDLDIREQDNKVIVKAEVPGMEEKDIKVHLEGDMLIIRGEKSAKREIKKKDYHYLEQSASSFQRSAMLPVEVSKGSKKTHYKNSVLTVEFLKKGGRHD